MGWGIKLRGGAGWFVDQLMPILRALWVRRTFGARIAESKAAAHPPDSHLAYLSLALPQIREAHRIEIQRRDQFTRKAQGYLMALTVMSSFSIGAIALTVKAASSSSTVQQPSGPSLSWTFWVGLLAMIASFTMAALSALWAVGPSEVFDVYLPALVEDGKPVDDERQKSLLLHMIALNQAYNLILAAFVRAAYIAMRNGAILLLVALCWLVIGYARR